MDVVQEQQTHPNPPTIHGWVFDIKTGNLIDLNIDFSGKLKSIEAIYDLSKGV